MSTISSLPTSRVLRRFAASAALASVAVLSACAGQAPSTDASGPAATTAASAEDFDLDELIAAAQQEGPITIYDNASAVEDIAANFTEKYGIEATGQKVDSAAALEMVQREAEAGNVVGDVIMIPDTPAVNNQLLPEGFVENWVPADLAEDIPEAQQNPLTVINDPNYWTFNPGSYNTCPVDNLWELTDPEWTGLVTLEDPVGHPKLLDYFSQLAQFGDEEMRAAYEEHYGEELDTDQETAAHEWVARLAANDPVLTASNEDVSEAVGAPGQDQAPMGYVASSKFRNIEEKGYEQSVCEGLTPHVGAATPKALVVASGSESPNAARLFVHFVMTEEGIAPQINDGKISGNAAIEQPADPSNTREHRDALFLFDNAGVDTDWATRQDWQDLWRVSAQ